FNKAMQHLIARHEILRTNFEEINGGPKQVVRSADRASFRLQQYEGYDEFDPTRLIDLLVARRFDLESDLLVRASVVRLEPQRQLLVFSTHSIIMDDWSLRLMVNELARNYNMYLRHGAIHSQPLLFQFKDYSTWMNGRIEKNKAAGEYWTRCLHDFEPGVFPRDMEEDKPSFRGEMLVFEPAEDNSAALKQLALEQNCNLFDVLAAMLSVLVFKYTGRQDICLGTVASGRQIPDLAGQLGMFANNIVVMSHLDENESFSGLLKHVRASVSKAFEHQSYPLEWIVENDAALFDVMMVYRSPGATFTRQTRIQGMELQPFEIPHRSSRFPLTFSFFEEQDDIFCNLEYNSEMFRIETIQIIMEKFQKLSAEIIQDPTKPIGSYSVELEIEKELKQGVSIELDF
ncbi:MAG TPA: condensation domain-containing protein, partial [Flavisolibacter sp.]